MSDTEKLRKRKKKIDDKKEELSENDIEIKKKEKLTFTGSQYKQVVEERRENVGKKLFRRTVKRVFLIIVAFVVVYFYNLYKNDQMKVFVSSKNEIFNIPLIKEVACFNQDYLADKKNYPHCTPKRCGRIVIDNLIDSFETNSLLNLAKKGLNYFNTNRSATILDLHSGAISYQDKFVNIYTLMKNKDLKIFTEAEFNIYKEVKNKIKKFIEKQFNIPNDHLFLTNPTFFSKLTSEKAISIHDEYWHSHIDKHTYKSFHYTSLLYLNTYYQQFSGGRFVFKDKVGNYTVEPKSSRLLVFTSGSENTHFVEKVEKGIRYAITISFTCDPKSAIKDISFN